MISMTKLSPDAGTGFTAGKVSKLALHKEAVLNLLGSSSDGEKDVARAKNTYIIILYKYYILTEIFKRLMHLDV